MNLILTALIIAGSILTYNYMENKEDIIKLNAGLEQCPKKPTWRDSKNIWVKDCGKYMKDWKAVQND